MPKPRQNESHDDFMKRCMAYPDMQQYESDQRQAICERYWEDRKSSKESDWIYKETLGHLKADLQSDNSLIVEGWLSTPEIDSDNEIIEPNAFKPVIEKYLKKPIVLFMHNFFELPVAKALSLEIIDVPNPDKPYPHRGVWQKTKILPTTMGKDLQILINEGVINSYSYRFKPKNWTIDSDSNVWTYHEFSELYETSICNLGANWDAVFQVAKSKGLNINALESFLKGKEVAGRKGVFIMPDGITKEDIQKDIDSAMNDVKGEFDTLKADVNSVKKQVGDIASLQKQMDDFKTSIERTETEKNEFIKKFASDFQKSIDDLNEAIKSVALSRVQYGTEKGLNIGITKALSMPTKRMQRRYSREAFGQIDEFRRSNDSLLMFAAMKLSRGGAVQADQIKKEHILEVLKRDAPEELDDLRGQAKAFLDSATSTEGTEYVPVMYSPRMTDMVRLESIVAQQFQKWPMRGKTEYFPVGGADTLATYESEATTMPSNFIETTIQTPGTANQLFTARKLRSHIPWSGDLDIDSIINMADFVETHVARGIARSLDKVIVAGDLSGGTGFDTGDLTSGTDCRMIANGIRQMVQSGNKINAGSFDETKLADSNSVLGKYAQFPTRHFFLTSITTLLKHLMNKDEMPSFMTLDKYGPQAIVMTGEMGKAYGSAILVSEFILDTYNNAGIYDGTTTDRSIILNIYRDAFIIGQRYDVTMEEIRNPFRDIFHLIARWRGDFQCIYDETAENVVSLLYNITTS